MKTILMVKMVPAVSRSRSLVTRLGPNQKLKKDVRRLKSLVNPEVKLFDTSLSLNPTTAGTSDILSLVGALTNDVNDRNGNKIKSKYLTGWFTMIMSGSATNTAIRCIIGYDRQNQTAGVPLPGVAGGPLKSASEVSLRNQDALGRYRILYDKLFTLSSSGNKILRVKLFKKLGKTLFFTGTASTNYYTNAIFIQFITNEPTNTPTIQANLRLAFTDS